MEILGHRDPRMTTRYQHLSPGHLRDAMQALERAGTPPAVSDAPIGTIWTPGPDRESAGLRNPA
jgi:hypothetical protein